MFPAIPRYLDNPEEFRERLRKVNGFEVENDVEMRKMI
jgi:hypothetical protein